MARTQHAQEVRAVLRYLVTAIGRPINFKTTMARPRLQSLGHVAFSPLMMHLIPSISAMQSLVSSLGLLVRPFFSLFLPLLPHSCLVFPCFTCLFFSFLSFSFFRFLFYFYISFPLSSRLFFVLFFRLTWVCCDYAS